MVFNGVSFQRVLRLAGIRTDSLRGATLADYLLLEAADGYRVVLTLGELSPDIGGRMALLADRRDAQPLGPTAAPLQLVLPQDGRPARWIRQLRTVTLHRASP